MSALPTAYFENGDPLYDGFIHNEKIWGYRHSLEETTFKALFALAEPQVRSCCKPAILGAPYDLSPSVVEQIADRAMTVNYDALFAALVRELKPTDPRSDKPTEPPFPFGEDPHKVKQPVALSTIHTKPVRMPVPVPLYAHNEDVILRMKADLRRLEAENIQLRFLLNQAPMLNAPENIERAAHAVTKFAYAQPATFRNIIGWDPVTFLHEGRSSPPLRIAPSPTEWILTNLVPLGRVIYSPNLIPGLEVKP